MIKFSSAVTGQWFVSDKLENASIVPIFKKRDKLKKENYRPVALLCNISKVFERLVYFALSEHFIKNKLLSTKNSGFKKCDGAVNQIIGIQDKIYNAFNANSEVAMVILDVAKALIVYGIKDSFTRSDFLVLVVHSLVGFKATCGESNKKWFFQASPPQYYLLTLVFLRDRFWPPCSS